MESVTIMVVDSAIGLIGEVYACNNSAYLFDLLGNDYPLDGTWFDAIGNVVEGGVLDFDVDPLGIYTYVFSADAGCEITLEVEAVADYEVGEEQSVTFCNDGSLFCVYDVYQSLQAEGVEVSPGGEIIMYDDSGNFLNFYVDGDVCFSFLTLESYGSNLVFRYFPGSVECETGYGVLNVSVGEQPVNLEMTACGEFIQLGDYVPEGLSPGGTWSNPLTGDIIPSDLSIPVSVGSSFEFIYSNSGQIGCAGNYLVTISIEQYEEVDIDLFFDFCGDGSEVALDTLLPEGVSTAGVFSPADSVILLPQNSGTYTYTLPDVGCEAGTYALHLNIGESLNYTNLDVEANIDGETYTVTFNILVVCLLILWMAVSLQEIRILLYFL